MSDGDPVDMKRLTWTIEFRLDDARLKQYKLALSGRGPCPFPLPHIDAILRGDWIPGEDPRHDGYAQVVQVIVRYAGDRSAEHWKNSFHAEIYARRLKGDPARTYHSSIHVPPPVATRDAQPADRRAARKPKASARRASTPRVPSQSASSIPKRPGRRR